MPQAAPLEIGVTINVDAPTIDVERLSGLLRFASNEENRTGEVGIWICSDDEIADLHLRYMGIPGPTDVISFPGDTSYLGDIAVSYETARIQAVDAEHSTQREIAYLTLHGLLHLLGYDDLTPQERERMLNRQDEIIDAFERETSDAR